MTDPAPPAWHTPPPVVKRRKRITRISVLKLGITFAALYGILSLIMVPFFLIVTLFDSGHSADNPHAHPAAFGAVFVLFLPVIYAVLGFIGGVLMAAVYNLVAKITGGVEITLQDVPAD